MLYHRDDETGAHLVTHEGVERRYRTRAAALSAAREMMSDAPATAADRPVESSAR